jgi:hypothetical protein
MSQQFKTLSASFFLSVLVLLSACESEDPGPLQEVEKEFSMVEFDRLEIGSAFNIRVEQSNTYGIHIRGDRRNIDDLEVFKTGSTLVIRFDDHGNRNHRTYITIAMPHLEALNFSGASVSTVNGFESDDELDIYLSGASVCQLNAGYRELNLLLTGASTLHMHGLGDEIHAEVSGASVLTAYDFPVRQAYLDVSGASSGKVTVTDELTAVATGASSVLYRGNPAVTTTVSGASSVRKD